VNCDRLVLAICALTAFDTAACTRRAESAAEPPPPPGTAWLAPEQIAAARIVVEPVSDKPVGDEVAASGRLTFHDLHVSHVFSPVTGRVVRIEAEPGQHVKAGDALVVIDSPDIGNTFSDLAKAQGDLLVADREQKRQMELSEAHAAAQRDLEAASAAFTRARAEFERAREKARLLRSGGASRDTQSYTLRAPISGEVVARNVNPGSEVQGQYGGGTAVELFTIGDLDPIVVVADVFEMDVGRVKAGAAMALTVPAYPGRVFHGKVQWVADQLDPTTRTVRVRGEIANPDHSLKSEMYAAVSIVADQHLKLAIARSALLRLGDQSVVFVETGKAPDGRIAFERRPVAVDEETGGTYLPVTAGLSTGERLVTSGAIMLSGMVQ
jgi:cobalt-zinc-cadmium efflux system membrane fusion protein